MSRSTVRTHTLFAALILAACSSSTDAPATGAPPPAPPPAAPAHGAPVAFEVTKVTPGKEFDGKIEVKAYNFADKKIAGYSIAARYTDQGGNVIKVGVGTPFEKDVAWTSLSGRKFACEPKAWCSFEIEAIEVPEGAAKTEVVATSVRALGSDGITFEEPDLWSSPDGMGTWPAAAK